MLMISRSSAIKIAKNAISGKIELQEGSPIEVVLKTGLYIITFIHVNPPEILGADYDAEVTIDAKTGQILGILGGT
jgi:uncharacterized membrane protein YkoI